ncbi:hypothetical protein [Chryseobacterium sp. MP_3.2]|uniref:hypothetical protein n=1 Tax=Chryseobacterium sp. MP_3.2 TaxID=3071712 RepID=UPI002E0059C4|nr:hypothetical protein [Chryseobacterium sp. MP_3.2]
MPSSRLTPASQSMTWDVTGPEPSISDISVIVIETKEVLYVQYSLQFVATSVNWLIATGITGSYLDFNGAGANLPLDFQNLNSLTPGVYKCNVIIEFSNDVEYVRTLTSEITLTVTGTLGITTDQPTYNAVFNRADNSLSGDTLVTILNNTVPKVLSFWQPSNLFEPKTGFTGSFSLEDNLTLSIASNPALPVTGTVNHQCKLLGPSSEFIAGFAINLLILDENGIGVQPSSLAFEVIKNTTEKTAVLSVINPLGIAFTVETPLWLVPSVSGGSASADITLTTSTSSLNPGTHAGIVKIVFAGGFIEVPVNLLLKQFISNNWIERNFCLDASPLYFTKINEAAKFVRTTMTATYVVNGVTSVFNQVYIVRYINDVAFFDLGKKLHTYFPRFQQHLFDLVAEIPFMQIIVADLILEELDEEYAVLLSENLNGSKFFPGSRPKMFPLFSNYEFRKKNKGSQYFVSAAEDDTVFTNKIPPTVADETLVFDAKTLKLYQYPAVFKPVHVQWENQNLVPEWFTMTGEFTISADFAHITAKNVLNSLLQKFETSKIKRLQINTGFILKEELELMEEFIDSRTAFLGIEDKIYRCFNVTSKMVLANSSESIIQRDLEFLIVEE